MAALCLFGCASVTGPSTQSVSVTTVCEGSIVGGVTCTLQNDKGQWTLVTPGSVVVHKSVADLSVTCESEESRGRAIFVSKNTGAVWANLLLGGVVGYAVDSGSGSGFDYPGQVPVVLSSPCPVQNGSSITTPKEK